MGERDETTARAYALYAAAGRPVVQNWLERRREATGRRNDAAEVFPIAYYDGSLILADIRRGVNDLNNARRSATRS